MNSLLILDHFLVQTPSLLRPVTVLTPQQVIHLMVNTPPNRVLLMVEVHLMLLMVKAADTLVLIPADLLVVTHHLLMDLPQEVLVTMDKPAATTVPTVSKN